MFIAVDFDGTIVDHQFPKIGTPCPGSFRWLRTWQDAGGKLILWTMRSDGPESPNALTAAVEFCRANGIEFFGVNCNPTQSAWTDSPKVYAHVYVDDAAHGCPLRESPRMGGKPQVDWEIVGPAVLAMIQSGNHEQPTQAK